MASYLNVSIDEEQRREWQLLRSGVGPIPEEELVRCEMAALQLRERLIGIPYYAEKDREDGMRYWRGLQAREYPIG